MKKFLAIIAIAGTVVACNNEGEGSNAADSSSLTTPSEVDTATVTNSTVTNATVDSTATQPLVDTAKSVTVDTTKAK